jgi:hypothetical protein
MLTGIDIPNNAEPVRRGTQRSLMWRKTLISVT